MATSIEPHRVVQPKAKHPASVAFFDNETALRQLIFGELAAAGKDAHAAAVDIERRGPRAVHDYRKALRRARAMLALVSEGLPRHATRTARRAIRDARRALGDARDHDVATTTIAQLDLGELERVAARAVLDTAQAARPSVDAIVEARDGAARVNAQIETIDSVLGPSVTWSAVLAGIAGVYRKARRAWKGAKRSRGAFHGWRRRSKELAYQLDLLVRHAGPRVEEIRQRIETVSDGQGPVVDLIMLRELVRNHGDGVAEEARGRLVVALKKQIADLMADARLAGRDSFRRKPAKFARALAKALRRDLEPAAVQPSA